MGKSSGSQTTNYSPWAAAQPSLMFGINEANRIYGSMYPGSAVPGYSTPTTSGGYNSYYMPTAFGSDPRQPNIVNPAYVQAMSAPPAPMQPFDPSQVTGYDLWAPAEEEMMRIIEGNYLTEGNPYIEGVIARSMADVTGQFAGMGRYGSGAHTDALFTSAAAPIRYSAYEAERNRQLAAIGALPAFQQGYAMAPYADLNAYLGLINPVASGGQQISQDLHSNPLAGAAGGALTGAGLAAAVSAPVSWPYILGGALLGGVAT